jgi:hypothetical protein
MKYFEMKIFSAIMILQFEEKLNETKKLTLYHILSQQDVVVQDG